MTFDIFIKVFLQFASPLSFKSMHLKENYGSKFISKVDTEMHIISMIHSMSEILRGHRGNKN